ncbi:MAG: hypothetical protein GC206_00225 [Alphaproteobacteria bacterium]|nr:hypothetical protein [Alphaproteobacteria bacterium]
MPDASAPSPTKFLSGVEYEALLRSDPEHWARVEAARGEYEPAPAPLDSDVVGREVIRTGPTLISRLWGLVARPLSRLGS